MTATLPTGWDAKSCQHSAGLNSSKPPAASDSRGGSPEGRVSAMRNSFLLNKFHGKAPIAYAGRAEGPRIRRWAYHEQAFVGGSRDFRLCDPGVHAGDHVDMTQRAERSPGAPKKEARNHASQDLRHPAHQRRPGG